MEPYRHKDYQSDWLMVTEHVGRPSAALVRCHSGGVEVTPDAIRPITDALYEGCGLEPPVTLERQDIPQDGSPIRYGDFQVKLSGGGVTVSLPGIEPLPIPPRAALELAAYIATYALLAETGADPAEVEELATAIRAAKPQTTEDVARTALLWMNARKTAAS